MTAMTRTSMMIENPSSLPGCERLGKLLFLQVDPTLRNLLAVLQRRQELFESSTTSNNKEEDNQEELSVLIGSSRLSKLENEEKILGLLKAEAELLLYLQKTLVEFPDRIKQLNPGETTTSKNNATADLDQQISEAMLILLDYVSLPLVAILRRPLTTLKQPPDNDHSKQQQEASSMETVRLRKLQIRRGAERKSIGIAARTLKLYLGAIAPKRDKNESSSSSESSISKQKILQLILACSTALPSGQEIMEQPTESSGVEEYLEAILDVVVFLLRLGSSDIAVDPLLVAERTAATSEDFGEEVIKAMDGALVAFLADACLSIMAPPSAFRESAILGSACALQTLMSTVPNISTWRGLFPGCFAALFRTLVVGLRGVSSAPQSRPKVTVAVLKAFCMLLRVTMKGGDTNKMESRNKVTLASLTLLVQSEGNKSVASSSGDPRKMLGDSSASYRNHQSTATDSDSMGRGGFLSEVNTRLPGPLSVVANLLVSAESSSIRQHAAEFYRIVLIETRLCWNRKVLDNMSIMALESCLVLTRDVDNGVASAAQTVLQTFQTTPASKRDMGQLLVPRILSMIEELPLLAQRQSEKDLRGKLKLITAFLSLNEMPDKNSPPQKSSTGKALRSALAAENVSLSVRQSLAELLDVDFGSPNVTNGVSIELVDQGNLLESTPNFHGSVRRRHLTPASENETITMVQGIGRILGPKHAAIFVDACIADLFNDCVTRVEAKNSRTGRSQEAWCHQWIGCLILMRDILKGGFSDLGQNINSSKTVRKKMKYLSSLATSILPIIVSAPLWDLPVIPPEFSEQQNDMDIADPLLLSTLPPSSEAFSSVALRGNAFFLGGLFQLAGSIVGLLQEEAIPLIPVLLPALLTHATTTKVPYVLEEAQTSLEDVASSVGYKTLAGMIDQNMGVVAGAMLATLRLPGGKSSMSAATAPVDIFHVAHTIRSVLQLVLHEKDNRDNVSDKDSSRDVSNYSYLLELVMTLTERYDCLASKNAFESDTTIAIVGVYEYAFRFLIKTYEAEATVVIKMKDLQNQKPRQPWFERLEAFRILRVDERDDVSDNGLLGDQSPKEGFDAYHKGQEDCQVENEEPSLGGESKLDQIVGSHETNFVAMLVSRCTFFFSNASLRLQVESCETMTQGFRFLAIVALLCKDPEDKSGTAILRQVSDAWPAIHARLLALTTEIMSTRVNCITVLRQSPSMTPSGRQATPDVSTKRVFVARLLDLVAIMAECSGGFIASRFKNDVFPLASQILGSFAEDLVENRDNLPPPYGNHNLSSTATTRWQHSPSTQLRHQASETAMITSVVQCFAKIFRVHTCGKAIAGLIPAASALIFPFLGEDGKLGNLCAEALQQMAQIDCDALWRPLLQLSGKVFPPPKPWLSRPPVSSSLSEDNQAETAKVDADVVHPESSSLLERRAKELIDFIGGLPEQELIY